MRNLSFALGAAILTFVTLAARGDDAGTNVSKSVVKIFANQQVTDYFRPWTRHSGQDATGSGVVIAGKRILTNAHVVAYATQIFVQFDKTGEKLPASVVAKAVGIDLAVLKLDDELAFDGHPALPISSKVANLQQAVFAYGYPQGGAELSITRGIVSRMEFAEYYLGVEGLRIQIDAAINPGNSGGPVVADGQLMGVAFSRLDKSDNIGYLIPVEEINLFLDDIKDGRYDGKPRLPIDTQTLENPALRAQLRLDKKTTGILVRKIHRSGEPYPLAVDDLLTKIGSYAIDNLGMVKVEGERRLRFQYLVQRLARAGRLAVTVMRKGCPTTVEVPVDSDPRSLFFTVSSEPLLYFIFGPLVFTETSEQYVRSMVAYADRDDKDGSRSLRMLYTANPAFTRYGDDPKFPGERIVIVPSPMFSHKIGRGYDDPYTEAVSRVNGTRVRNLRHLVEVLRDSSGPFVEFTFGGRHTGKIVFNRKEALAATEEILTDNGIRQQCSPELLKIWDVSRAR
jgi:S1-C subfamily serine protease